MSYDSLLNRYCTVYKSTVAQDATSRQQVETWLPIYTGVKCRLDEASGREIAAEGSILARADHVLFLNHGFVLNAGKYRVSVEGTTYNVLLVKNAGGQNHHLELLLQVFQ